MGILDLMYKFTLRVFELPIHTVGLALTAGFSAAIADGNSIGVITSSSMKGLVLLPILPMILRMSVNLAMFENRARTSWDYVQRIWNILTACSLLTWYILFMLKLGVGTSINFSYVVAFIPLFIYFGGLFFGSLFTLMVGSNARKVRSAPDVDSIPQYDPQYVRVDADGESYVGSKRYR